MALVLLKLLVFVLGFGVAHVRVFDLAACLALAVSRSWWWSRSRGGGGCDGGS